MLHLKNDIIPISQLQDSFLYFAVFTVNCNKRLPRNAKVPRSNAIFFWRCLPMCDAFMKSLFKKVYFKFYLKSAPLKPQLAFRLCLRRWEYSVVSGKDKWSSRGRARVAGNVSSWKKVSIVFHPIRFLSFGAARRYLRSQFPSFSRLWDFMWLLMRKY